MRALQGENAGLQGSMEECTSTIELMQTEMKGLKKIASEGVSNIRNKERLLLEEQRRDKDALKQLKRKLESANKLIHSLQSSRDGCGVFHSDEVSSASDELSLTR